MYWKTAKRKPKHFIKYIFEYELCAWRNFIRRFEPGCNVFVPVACSIFFLDRKARLRWSDPLTPGRVGWHSASIANACKIDFLFKMIASQSQFPVTMEPPAKKHFSSDALLSSLIEDFVHNPRLRLVRGIVHGNCCGYLLPCEKHIN